MILQDDHNYQPIVIVTLVQNGGSATLEEFKTQLQKANPELVDQHRVQAIVHAQCGPDNKSRYP